ncbi:MAG: hypothetical protein K5Q68_17285 [Roseococcus sp.]|nr:hypothetical protein [Roseococcus sp.]
MQVNAIGVHRPQLPHMKEGTSTHAVQVMDGHAPLPTRPGLGVELDDDHLKRCDRLEA